MAMRLALNNATRVRSRSPAHLWTFGAPNRLPVNSSSLAHFRVRSFAGGERGQVEELIKFFMNSASLVARLLRPK